MGRDDDKMSGNFCKDALSSQVTTSIAQLFKEQAALIESSISNTVIWKLGFASKAFGLCEVGYRARAYHKDFDVRLNQNKPIFVLVTLCSGFDLLMLVGTSG
jgi:hypothetical protein